MVDPDHRTDHSLSGTEHETAPLALDEVIEVINEVESDVSAENWTGASRGQILEGTCNRIRGRIRARSLTKAKRSQDTESDRSE